MFENYTIRQFENAWFKNDRSVMSEEEFDIVYSEYVDAAGLFEYEELERVSVIHYLSSRINSIKIGVALQKEFMNNFQVPYTPDFARFKKLGHNLFWDGNAQSFIKALDLVVQKEKKYISQLEKKMKELIDFRAKKNAKEQTVKQTRPSFIKMKNTLGKIGYNIDSDKTTVEEFALMIKQQTDEVEEMKNKPKY